MTRGPQRIAEPLTLDGGKLGALSFEWLGDRYCHQWQLNNQSVLASVEGNSGCVWPDAPPLQQIHQQSFGDGREVVFGVGMSGRGHWSASFTLVPDLRCWIIELACRSPVKPDSLASSYQVSDAWKSASAGSWELQVGEASVRLEPIQPATIATRLDDLLKLFPTAISDIAPSTTQWAFRLRVTE